MIVTIKRQEPVPTPIEKVIIELTYEEAQQLLAVCNAASINSTVAGNFYCALSNRGVKLP